MGMIRGMIRGHDSGYDSRKCNMHVVINSVYTISGNIRMGMIREGFVRKFKAVTLRSLEVLRKLKRLKPQKNHRKRKPRKDK